MCTAFLPLGDNPIAVNKYILPYHKPTEISQGKDELWAYTNTERNLQDM